jgi:Tfp pilus assembly protein FimT
VAAFSLIDLVFALGLAATLAAVGLPSAAAALDDVRAAAAARYVNTRLQHARVQAIRRNTSTGLRFVARGTEFSIETYADGNGNGVLSQDIQNGVDPAVAAQDSLGERFQGVEFGAIPNLPAVDSGSTPPGTDPIRFGASDMAVFVPSGSASSGTVYLASRGGAQYAVRVYGETGRTRVLKFHPVSRRWTAISGAS